MKTNNPFEKKNFKPNLVISEPSKKATRFNTSDMNKASLIAYLLS